MGGYADSVRTLWVTPSRGDAASFAAAGGRAVPPPPARSRSRDRAGQSGGADAAGEGGRGSSELRIPSRTAVKEVETAGQRAKRVMPIPCRDPMREQDTTDEAGLGETELRAVGWLSS